MSQVHAATPRLIESINSHFQTPSNTTITLDESAPYPYTINTLIAKLSAGTITAAIQINAVSVTGISAAALTTTQSTATATAANSVAVDNRVTLVLSSNAGAANLAFTLKTTRV
jgi:hypothetical protein